MRARNRSWWRLGAMLAMLVMALHAQAEEQLIAAIKSQDVEPFNQALAGFVTACDSRITEYDLRGSKKRGGSVLRRVMADKPTLILAIGPLAAQVVQKRVRDIPVIFVMVPHPHKYGLGGENTAGISLDIPVETQFSTYKALVPNLQTIGVIYDPAKTRTTIEKAGVIAERSGLRLLATPVSSYKEVPAALRSMLGKIDALWMVPDDTVVTPESFKFLLIEAFENNLPFLAVSDIFVEVGALAALSPDYTALGRQGCELVRGIEAGRLRLAEVNVFPPAKINLAINLKTASKIGLTLPAEVVQSASKVYR